MSDQQLVIEDKELVVRAGRGDKLAFGVLYERYFDLIVRYIFYRVANISDAEDLTEQVFLKIWEKLPHPDQGEQIQHFRAWIYRIAHNIVVDYHRTKKEWLSLDEKTLLEKDKIKNPETVVEMNQENYELAKAIANLEPRSQQVIVHRFIHGYSHAETAILTNLNENHVRVLQHRALKKLRYFLSD